MTRVSFLQTKESDSSHLSAHAFPTCPRSQHTSLSETIYVDMFIEQVY